jgi:hypothetical protein
MEIFNINDDIKVFYITSDSFPNCISDTFNTLQSLFTYSKERRIFCLSRPENNGEIVYRAAAEEMYTGESEKLNCETLIIPKGTYISIKVSNFRNDKLSIYNAFQKLLKEPNIDPQGYCVEWYASEKEEVNCMIRIIK